MCCTGKLCCCTGKLCFCTGKLCFVLVSRASFWSSCGCGDVSEAKRSMMDVLSSRRPPSRVQHAVVVVLYPQGGGVKVVVENPPLRGLPAECTVPWGCARTRPCKRHDVRHVW